MQSHRKRDGMRRGILSIVLVAFALVLFAVPGFSAIQAPGNVQAQLVHNEVHITWSAVTNASLYNVYRSTDNSTFTLLGNTTATAYIDKSLNASGTYYYKIEAVNGTDTNSTVITVKFYPPATPTGFTAIIQSGKVVLNWNSVTGATGYYVYRGTSANNTTVLVSTISNSYTDTSVVGGTTYYYYVTAYNATGESQGTSIIKITVSSGGGVVETHGIAFNSYLLGISIFLLAFGVPLYFYGAEKHKDVAMYTSIVGFLGLIASWGLIKAGYKTQMLTIAGIGFNSIFAVFGVIMLIVGIALTLMAKDERKMRKHLDVGRFSMLVGVVLLILSYVWSYIA